MIARERGQIVLVAGAIPGERVTARITRIGKGVAYADTVGVEEASADRREPTADPLCGGSLYAHIAYPRQLEIKSLIVADAFARIGRMPLPSAVAIAASPLEGYRMRARLHRGGSRFGFFREGTHELCDPRASGQLLSATCDFLDRLPAALGEWLESVREIEIAENLDASQRVAHLDMTFDAAGMPPDITADLGLTGLSASDPAGRARVLGGSPYVDDTLDADGVPCTLRRHVLAFFQGNRFLLRDFVAHVVNEVPEASGVVDLYAGGGLFAVAAALGRHARVTAVEGDRVASEDLIANAQAAGGAVTAVHQAVERFVQTTRVQPDVVIVDPPRTGLSREALDGEIRLHPSRLIYVSCDVATLARDARRLADAGYSITRADGFDLFPNTPHVETVAMFET